MFCDAIRNDCVNSHEHYSGQQVFLDKNNREIEGQPANSYKQTSKCPFDILVKF